jgi:methyl-accepting chemotaxis protein
MVEETADTAREVSRKADEIADETNAQTTRIDEIGSHIDEML